MGFFWKDSEHLDEDRALARASVRAPGILAFILIGVLFLRRWDFSTFISIIFTIICVCHAYIYRDHIGYGYVHGRTEKIHINLVIKIGFSLAIAVMPIVFYLVVLFPHRWLDIIYSHSILVSIFGFIVSILGLTIVFVSKRQLGKNYSPCTDLYLPIELCTGGIYRRIRHPLYLGNCIMFFGFCIVTGSVTVTVISMVIIISYILSALAEEKAIAAKFLIYEDYKKSSGRFFPSIK